MNNNADNLNSKYPARVVQLASWQEFHQLASGLTTKRGYVWRGQKRDESRRWYLKSSFDRKVRTRGQHDRANQLGFRLAKFREAMTKFYPGVIPHDPAHVWALGQHYGLLTPLLDWTSSPYVAAYFAFIEGIDQDDAQDSYRYVYALNRSIERLLPKSAGQWSSGRRAVLFIDQLPFPNPRFTAQRGIFTDAFQGKDIWKYVQKFSRKRPGQVLIVKFKIPTKDREECLRDLHLMNIDHTSLLLDLRKAVDYCDKELRRRRSAARAAPGRNP